MRTVDEIEAKQEEIAQELHDIHEKYNFPPDIKAFLVADKANQLRLLEWVIGESGQAK